MTAVRSVEETAEQHSESVPRLATLEGENQQMPSLKENDTSQSPGQQRKQASARRYQLRPEAPVFIPSASRPSGFLGFPGFAGSALNPAASSFVLSSRPAIAAPHPDDPNVAGIRGIAKSSPPAQHSRASPACSQPSQRSAALIPSKSLFPRFSRFAPFPHLSTVVCRLSAGALSSTVVCVH